MTDALWVMLRFPQNPLEELLEVRQARRSHPQKFEVIVLGSTHVCLWWVGEWGKGA